MRLKTTEILVSIISLYLSFLVLCYTDFFKFNIEYDFIYKIFPAIITAGVATYVGYEARKITTKQKEIAEAKLDLDYAEKRIVPYLLLREWMILLYDVILFRHMNKYSNEVGDKESKKEVKNLINKVKEKMWDFQRKYYAYDFLYTDNERDLFEKADKLLVHLLSHQPYYAENFDELDEKMKEIGEYTYYLKKHLTSQIAYKN